MIRARFKANLEDPRPVTWPIKHPYWVSGEEASGSNDRAILIAYADDEAQIMELWPDAEEIEYEEVNGYKFTTRFIKPEWFNE